jgi:hypothetical protein
MTQVKLTVACTVRDGLCNSLWKETNWENLNEQKKRNSGGLLTEANHFLGSRRKRSEWNRKTYCTDTHKDPCSGQMTAHNTRSQVIRLASWTVLLCTLCSEVDTKLQITLTILTLRCKCRSDIARIQWFASFQGSGQCLQNKLLDCGYSMARETNWAATISRLACYIGPYHLSRRIQREKGKREDSTSEEHDVDASWRGGSGMKIQRSWLVLFVKRFAETGRIHSQLWSVLPICVRPDGILIRRKTLHLQVQTENGFRLHVCPRGAKCAN